jgi:titin
VTLGPSATSTTLDGLTNGTLYDIGVVAENRYGTGPSSSTSSTPTYLSEPLAPVDLTAHVTTVSGQPGSILVTWEAPPAGGCVLGVTGYASCKVTGFTLSYTKWLTASTSTKVNVTVPSGTSTSHRLSTRLNGSTDTVTLRAQNTFGPGAAASVPVVLRHAT